MNNNIVIIEHCRNCKRHQWNTRHNEDRYINLFNEFKTQLEKHNIIVKQSPTFRLGSFEIQMNGITLFSKSKSQLFPDVKNMVNLILKFIEEYKHEDERQNILQKFNKIVFNQRKLDRAKTQMNNRQISIRNIRHNQHSTFFSSRGFSQPFMETFHSRILANSSMSSRVKGSRVLKATISVEQFNSHSKQMIDNHLTQLVHTELKEKKLFQQDAQNPEKHLEHPKMAHQEISKEVLKETVKKASSQVPNGIPESNTPIATLEQKQNTEQPQPILVQA